MQLGLRVNPVTMAMHSETTICRSVSWSLTLSLSRSARPDSLLRHVGIILTTYIAASSGEKGRAR